MAEFRIDLTGLEQVRAAIEGTPRKVDIASRRAINRTLTTGRAETVRRLRKDYKVAARVLRDRLKITKATGTVLEGRITPLGKGIPLIDFQARQTRRGVTYSARSGRRTLSSGFIANTSRGRQVLRRARDPSGRGLVGRLPVYIKYGPGMYEMFGSVLEQLQIDLTGVFAKNFNRELDYELNRA